MPTKNSQRLPGNIRSYGMGSGSWTQFTC